MVCQPVKLCYTLLGFACCGAVTCTPKPAHPRAFAIQAQQIMDRSRGWRAQRNQTMNRTLGELDFGLRYRS